jgi:hypothetical protein
MNESPDTPTGLSRLYNLAQYQASQLPLPTIPGSHQTPPTQERGHRPHAG